MYKIILLNFSSEITWPISIKFHVDPTVETDWEFVQIVMLHRLSCPYTEFKKNKKKKTTLSSPSKPRTAQMMILPLVAMTGLEKYCITSAYLQWLFHSGERAMWPVGVLFFLTAKIGPSENISSSMCKTRRLRLSLGNKNVFVRTTCRSYHSLTLVEVGDRRLSSVISFFRKE